MSERPEIVRFHYARQAPSPQNWYTQPDYAGCALKWPSPHVSVVSYIIFRTRENLPTDCCDDLLDGYLEEETERLDIDHPITCLVDDEIHEKNRYLVLACLDNGTILWVQHVESSRFTGPKPGENWTWWSNPNGNKPRYKDPCRLDYANIRVEENCTFAWDYPAEFPDLEGYDLIVSDNPISPHTGYESDIEAFHDLLEGRHGSTIYPIEPYVNAIVDNVSKPGRFWYYALLVRLPVSGRVQIPIRHLEAPAPGMAYKLLQYDRGWGVGEETMKTQFERWKAGDLQAASDQNASHAHEGTDGLTLSFFRHSPDLTLDSYITNPTMIGIMFHMKVSLNLMVFAIRSVEPLSPKNTYQLLQKAKSYENYTDEALQADVYVFSPIHELMQLIDADCHNKLNYAFATYDIETNTFEDLQVKDLTIDFLPNFDTTIFWGNLEFTCNNHLANYVKCETFTKKTTLTIDFGIIDDTFVRSIEVYIFKSPIDWEKDGKEAVKTFHELQRNGKSPIGKRYTFKRCVPGCIDDITPNMSDVCCAALYLDQFGNRYPLSISSLGNAERSTWPALSSFQTLPDDPEPEQEDRLQTAYHSETAHSSASTHQAVHTSESKDDNKKASRFSWGEEEENVTQDDDEQAQDKKASRFSWGEEEKNVTQYDDEQAQDKKVSRFSWGEEEENVTQYDDEQAQDKKVSRFSWGEEEENVTQEEDEQAQDKKVSRFSWGEEEEENVTSEEEEQAQDKKVSRFSWGEEEENVTQEEDEQAQEQKASRFSWGEEDESVTPEEDALEQDKKAARFSWGEEEENVTPEPEEDEQAQDKKVSRFSWGEEEENVTQEEDAQEQKASRFSWGEEEENEDTISQQEENLTQEPEEDAQEQDKKASRFSWGEEEENEDAISQQEENVTQEPEEDALEQDKKAARFSWGEEEENLNFTNDGEAEGEEKNETRTTTATKKFEWDDDDDDDEKKVATPSSMTIKKFEWDDDDDDEKNDDEKKITTPSSMTLKKFEWDDDDEDDNDKNDEKKITTSSSLTIKKFEWDDD